ncbi:MAG TPA: hypothetical protein VII72_06125 [Myxococcota bacterium]
MRRALRSAFCLCTPVFALGCFTHPPLAQYTFVTTEAATLRVEVLKEGVSGWTCVVSTFLDGLTRVPIPTREMELGIPNQAYAVEMALRTVPGSELLIDTTFDHHVEERVLWKKTCVTVTGTAARLVP